MCHLNFSFAKCGERVADPLFLCGVSVATALVGDLLLEEVILFHSGISYLILVPQQFDIGFLKT